MGINPEEWISDVGKGIAEILRIVNGNGGEVGDGEDSGSIYGGGGGGSNYVS